MSTSGHIHYLDFAVDPLAWTARRIIELHQDRLPLLDPITLIVEEPSVSTRLRSLLTSFARDTDTNRNALLGPRIVSLREFVNSFPVTDERRLLSSGRELILIEALKEFPNLLQESDPWRLCETLLGFFDELSLYHVDPDPELDQFSARIRQAYGSSVKPMSQLQEEAALVFNLWHAWQTHLQDRREIDTAQWYRRMLQQLDKLLAPPDPDKPTLFILGVTRYTPSELDCVESLRQGGHAEVIIHDTAITHNNSLASISHALAKRFPRDIAHDSENQAGANLSRDFFNTVFAHEQQILSRRANDWQQQCADSPVQHRVAVHVANGTEEESVAIEIQTRLWLANGAGPIGIVVEDRKLARRIRALLERSGIRVQDLAGWTLSTTSAATVIEKWLECLESGFNYHVFLDFLKSPFVNLLDDREYYDRLVNRFEQDIVLHENIAGNLNRYLAHIDYRSKRLDWTGSATEDLKRILLDLQQVQQLFRTLRSGKLFPAAEFIDTLLQSLDKLNITGALNADAAGQRILETLFELQATARNVASQIHWQDFRTWLDQALENTHFKPEPGNSQVMLLSLAQTRLMRFDRLVIAANEPGSYPGNPTCSPWFNDQVRRELGLPDWPSHLGLRFHDYRRLLESVDYPAAVAEKKTTANKTEVDKSAPENIRLLLTRRGHEDAEPVQASPWLEAIQTFHELCYGSNLETDWLKQACALVQTDCRDDTRLPTHDEIRQAAVRVPANRLPQEISVSTHQKLIDCPYQFFCRTVLGLEAAEEIREKLSRAEYGSLVHRALEAFHAPDYNQTDKLPAPWPSAFTAANRAGAIEHLEATSKAVFSQELEDNLEHQAWLRQWLKRVPEYIDWQIERAREYRVEQTEVEGKRAVDAALNLKGRLDRVDVPILQEAGKASRHLVDYKTGNAPTFKQIDSGEDVQLLSYALLLDNVDGVEYLRLNQDGVESKWPLQGEKLADASAALLDRLATMFAQMRDGTPLPAWENNKVCQYCQMSGICRKQLWSGQQAGDPAH